MRTGRLVIISGPSGVGKTTVRKRLLAECPLPLFRSVSATTRPPRPLEQDHVDYHFLTDDEFHRLRQAGEFLECCEVFGRGYWYGTLKSEVASGLAAGKWVILEIDVEGAMKVLQQTPEAITVFVHPGSMEELERRLRGRGAESEEAILRRLEVARHELTFASQYRHLVENKTVEQTVHDICRILTRIHEGEECSKN